MQTRKHAAILTDTVSTQNKTLRTVSVRKKFDTKLFKARACNRQTCTRNVSVLIDSPLKVDGRGVLNH